jgi:hypothetical protein
MKSKIIYLNPAAQTASAMPPSARIHFHADPDLVDSALVVWLGLWTLVATFAFFAI